MSNLTSKLFAIHCQSRHVDMTSRVVMAPRAQPNYDAGMAHLKPSLKRTTKQLAPIHSVN
eukprot:2700756-Amphidinium_carterae.1